MGMADAPARMIRRWLRPTPGRLVVVLLAVVGFLIVSQWFDWFAFNEKRHHALLIAAATVVVMLLLMFFWFLFALVFRWRFQFSIRSLLVLMVVVAILGSWLAAEKQQARQQRNAVAAIRALGAEVIYDYEREWHSRPRFSAALNGPPVPPGPAWARRLLGDDFFACVLMVGYRKPPFSIHGWGPNPITDDCLEQVAKLPRLGALDLEGSGVSDEGLKVIKGLGELRDLKLAHTSITDRGLGHVAKVADLQALDLDWTQVTDAGLEKLAQLRGLRYLRLVCTATTPEGVAKLQRALPRCQVAWWRIEFTGPAVNAHPPTASELRREWGMEGVGELPAEPLRLPLDPVGRHRGGDNPDH